jgi:hypothetical protein
MSAIKYSCQKINVIQAYMLLQEIWNLIIYLQNPADERAFDMIVMKMWKQTLHVYLHSIYCLRAEVRTGVSCKGLENTISN